MQRRVGSRYVLSELLGRGSFGTVWRGEGPAGPVAVKILREEFADNPELVNRFIRERAAMRRLSHPHIVPVRDLVAEGDLLALVMDVIDGPNLREHLRDRSRLTVAEALGLAAAMATALAHAHDQGVVHRDVKPENVLLHPAAGGESVPMLTDFGIARLVEETSTTRSVVLLGTPLYMAPELADGQRGGPPADVYATGVVLYELLAGHPPFTAEHPLAVLRQHVTTAPARPRGVADPVWALLAECLAKDPAARPTAAVLARRLNDLADGRITGWASPPAAPTLRAPTGPLHSDEGRAPRAVRAGLAATIAVVLGLGGCLAGAAGGYRAGAGASGPPPTATGTPGPSPTATGTPGPSPSWTWRVEELAYTQVSNGVGPAEPGRANGGDQPDDGGPLTIGGTQYQHGLGVHAPSHVRVRPGGACERFSAMVGVAGEAASQSAGSVQFIVYGDGTALFDSGPLTWQQQPVAVDVDIRGRAIVDLVVGDGGDGAAQDSAAWADAHLICVSN